MRVRAAAEGRAFLHARYGAHVATQRVSVYPPLAVQRLQTGTFPMSFTLSQDNVMLPGVIFEGTVNLLARIDADSNAMTREPDAPSAALAGVAVGTNDVDLLLALPQ